MGKILVIGESCKDVFVYCDAKRLAPDVPVPVLNIIRQTENPGMAGNVVANIKSLQPDSIVSIINQPEHITKTRYVDIKTNHMFIRVDEGEEHIFPMMWRFLAIDDEDVEVMISRDADARLSYREKHCVDIFMESEFLLHSIRDNPSHNNIMGGMWGIKKNNRVKMNELSKDWKGHYYDSDQKFLREKLVPLFNDSYLIHCSTYLKMILFFSSC